MSVDGEIAAMPAAVLEIATGKIALNVLVEQGQSAIVLVMARYIFHVPFLGVAQPAGAGGHCLSLHANLAVGYTFSTIAQNQLQAMDDAGCRPSCCRFPLFLCRHAVNAGVGRDPAQLPISCASCAVCCLKANTAGEIAAIMLAFIPRVRSVVPLRFRRTLD